jgi:hypothetical protein
MDLVDKIIELTDLFDDNVVTTADKIPQPEPRKDVLDREAINRFMKDNPPSMAGGGRINFDGGGSPLQKFRQEIVESMKPYAPDDVTEDQLQLVVKDITLDMTAKQAQASALSNFRKLFGMAKGGRIPFQEAGSVSKGGRPIAKTGVSAYIREVLGKLPKGGRFDAEALAKDVIQKFPDSSKSFIDKRDGSISTSTIYKVIQKDKSLAPLKLKPYNQAEKTIIRAQNFIDNFIKENNRNPTVGEVKVGANVDPTYLKKYKKAGDLKGMQDTVFDAHQIAIDYLNKTEKPSIKELQKLVGGAQRVKNAETLLSNMYLRTLEAMRNRSAGIDQPSSVYKDFSIKELNVLKEKIRAVPGYKDLYTRQIEDLVSEAYKNQPKKLDKALKKIGKFKKLNSELQKIGVNLQLDHPLSFDFINKAKGGADPDELIRVTPIPERVNNFKSNLDNKLIDISNTLKNKPGDKKALSLYADAQSIANDLGIDIGKISKAGNIISAQAARIGDVPLLPDVKKGATIQNAFRNFVKNVKDDPRVKRLGINLNKLTDLAKAKAVNSTEYLKVVDNFVGKAGKFGIPIAGGYGFYKAAGFDEPAMAADGTEATGFTTGEKLAGAATAGGAYKFRKPIIKGAKVAGKGALKLLAPFGLPIEGGFVLSDLKSGASVPEALADVVMAGGIFRERDKRKFIEDKYGTETLNRYVAAKTPGITDYMDMPTALPALSEELQRIDTEADAYLQTLRGERAAEFERKSNLPRPGIDPFQAAGGGIAKLAGDPSGAMLQSMNPDSQGLRSLKKRVKTI